MHRPLEARTNPVLQRQVSLARQTPAMTPSTDDSAQVSLNPGVQPSDPASTGIRHPEIETKQQMKEIRCIVCSAQ
jgi:hypothetical protein